MKKNHIISQRLNNLLSNYSYFIFISPHLDDAIFSCANLLLELKNKNVTIITVFTKATDNVPTPQARDFLKASMSDNPVDIFNKRAIEDINATKFVGAKHVHLGFLDAAWRTVDKKPVYANGKSQFSGKIAKKDIFLINQIKTKVLKIIPKRKKFILLAPLGIGGHADHVLVRELVRNLPFPKIFWEDFPYSLRAKCKKEFISKNNNFEPIIEIKSGKQSLRKIAIKKYKSQIKFLFPDNKIPIIKERYYISKNDDISL